MRQVIFLQILLALTLSNVATALSGAVVNPDGGNGIENCTVIVTAGSDKYVTYTGSDGIFNINMPNNVAYTLEAIKTGHERVTSSGTSSATAIRINMQDAPAGLTIKVIKEDGSPLSYASVDAGTFGTHLTDASGSVSFTGEYGQTYEVTVSRSNYFFAGQLSGTLEGDTERVIVGIAD